MLKQRAEDCLGMLKSGMSGDLGGGGEGKRRNAEVKKRDIGIESDKTQRGPLGLVISIVMWSVLPNVAI